MDYTVPGILQARILGWVAIPSPGDLSNPGIKSRSPALQADSLPAEPQGKSKNIGVGSLSLLQRIFPTQESNWGLPHCRWILYQSSYQGRYQTILIIINNFTAANFYQLILPKKTRTWNKLWSGTFSLLWCQEQSPLGFKAYLVMEEVDCRTLLLVNKKCYHS